MILQLFTVLVALSFFIIWIGYKYNDKGYLTIGWFFVFLLALVLINNQLTYQTGLTANVTSANITVTSYNYTAYTDTSSHWIGYFLAIGSSLGMIMAWMFPNSNRIDND